MEEEAAEEEEESENDDDDVQPFEAPRYTQNLNVKCAIHLLNLVLKDAFKKAKDMKSLRKVLNAFRVAVNRPLYAL